MKSDATSPGKLPGLLRAIAQSMPRRCAWGDHQNGRRQLDAEQHLGRDRPEKRRPACGTIAPAQSVSAGHATRLGEQLVDV